LTLDLYSQTCDYLHEVWSTSQLILAKNRPIDLSVSPCPP